MALVKTRFGKVGINVFGFLDSGVVGFVSERFVSVGSVFTVTGSRFIKGLTMTGLREWRSDDVIVVSDSNPDSDSDLSRSYSNSGWHEKY